MYVMKFLIIYTLCFGKHQLMQTGELHNLILSGRIIRRTSVSTNHTTEVNAVMQPVLQKLNLCLGTPCFEKKCLLDFHLNLGLYKR